jgi:hypothetical protein
MMTGVRNTVPQLFHFPKTAENSNLGREHIFSFFPSDKPHSCALCSYGGTLGK